MLCSFVTDLVIPDIQCRECLRASMGGWCSEYVSQRVTSFSLNASPRFCAPPAPITLLPIVSVVSVCEHQCGGDAANMTVSDLLGLPSATHPDTALPQHRSRYSQYSVSWVSVSINEGRMQRMWQSASYLVHSQRVTQLLRSHSTDPESSSVVSVCDHEWM